MMFDLAFITKIHIPRASQVKHFLMGRKDDSSNWPEQGAHILLFLARSDPHGMIFNAHTTPSAEQPALSQHQTPVCGCERARNIKKPSPRRRRQEKRRDPGIQSTLASLASWR
jgi:hypothetical protein